MCKIKQYTYNFNDKNTIDNMYMQQNLHSYIVINNKYTNMLLNNNVPLSYV